MNLVLKINFLEGSEEKKREDYLRQAFMRVMFVFLIVWLFLGIFNYFAVYRINCLKQRISAVETAWEETRPLLEKKEYFLQWKENFGEIFKFLKNSFRKNYSWTKILKDLSKVIPEEIWFRELSLKGDRGGKILEINASVGYLSSDEEMLRKINSFVDAVRKADFFFLYFTNLDLQDVKKSKTKDREVMDFVLLFSLK